MIPRLTNVRLLTSSTTRIRFNSTLPTSTPPKTAGCIIIGDEILNSKIQDSNSRYFAKFCYNNGIQLNKISVVGDNAQDINSTVSEFHKNFELTITSGGIGATHDDITYDSIAQCFGLPLKFSQIAFDRYLSLRGDSHLKTLDDDQLTGFKKMFNLPFHEDRVELLFAEHTWTPVVRIDQRLSVLPGVPRFFEILLDDALAPHLNLSNDKEKENGVGYVTFYVTTKMSEIRFGPLISKKQQLINEKGLGVKIGSYPHFEVGFNTISVCGKLYDEEFMKSLVEELCSAVHGKQISADEEFLLSNNRSMEELQFLSNVK
ncbi:unnamed protein product [Ambrosiozyma monospora]|uniref:Unnamed protein product n=1 Tax=Ambrosiozyma monospora TaxID=43982 RepID=A0A9W7DJ85_AMBMO|nr:unnamed protein product [Ambrosiozyma monospora]